MSTTLMQLRFGRKILSFDIVKAFNQIELNDIDQKRLCFLWYKNVSRDNFEMVGYISQRLMFGLRCSPAILMLALYIILIIEQSSDSGVNHIKKMIWDLVYMDNASISFDTTEEMLAAYASLSKIFSPYKFELQQFITNDPVVQTVIDEDLGVTTGHTNKLLGLN